MDDLYDDDGQTMLIHGAGWNETHVHNDWPRDVYSNYSNDGF